jgi:putative endonuclease
MYVYILASQSRRLYVGVTNDLVRRVWEHKEGAIAGFTKRYGIKQNPEWHDLAESWFADVKRADFSRSLP